MSQSDVVYYYDGSFYGFLSGVFDAFAQKEEPMLFLSQEEEEQPLLFDSHFVETDPQKARRVLAGVQRTLGSRGVDIVREGFLTRLPQREYLLLKFLRQGFRGGAAAAGPADKGAFVLPALRHPEGQKRSPSAHRLHPVFPL